MLEALGQLIRSPGGRPAIKTLTVQAPTWLVQFPSLIKAEQREALQRETVGATRERMLREICEAFEVLAAEDPFVLILEDLHWVDHSTLDLISALARRRSPARLMVLGTYRPVEVILAQSPLKVLKQDLLVHRLCRQISLERLEEPDVAEYIAGRFAGSSLPSEPAALVHQHSDGNPLFMGAILDHMIKEGLLSQVQDEWKLKAPLAKIDPGVPETLQQMLEVQIEELSSQEQRILRCASVAGERFSVWAVAAILDSKPAQVEEALSAGFSEILRSNT